MGKCGKTEDEDEKHMTFKPDISVSMKSKPAVPKKQRRSPLIMAGRSSPRVAPDAKQLEEDSECSD